MGTLRNFAYIHHTLLQRNLFLFLIISLQENVPLVLTKYTNAKTDAGVSSRFPLQTLCF